MVVSSLMVASLSCSFFQSKFWELSVWVDVLGPLESTMGFELEHLEAPDLLPTENHYPCLVKESIFLLNLMANILVVLVNLVADTLVFLMVDTLVFLVHSSRVNELELLEIKILVLPKHVFLARRY